MRLAERQPLLAPQKGSHVDSTRRTALVAGLLYLITFAASVPAVFLLAPLAKIPDGKSLRDGIGAVLDGLDLEDTRQVYKAIRLARPSGLGRVESQDVAAEPGEQVDVLHPGRVVEVGRGCVVGRGDIGEDGPPETDRCGDGAIRHTDDDRRGCCFGDTARGAGLLRRSAAGHR